MSHFDFKQFRIHHDRCAMKVGTDGVLIGAWAEVGSSRNILDIGTGTGLVAIMAAQRTEGKVTGIEINEGATKQAIENAEGSPFANRLSMVNCDLRDFHPDDLFDNIISNPPYFTEQTLPPNSDRATARHTQGLSLETLVKESKRLMRPDALLQVIIPYAETSRFLNQCTLCGMSLLQRTDICTKAGKPFKRTLLRVINNIEATQPISNVLCLSNDEGKRSSDYKLLTQDYYL